MGGRELVQITMRSLSVLSLVALLCARVGELAARPRKTLCSPLICALPTTRTHRPATRACLTSVCAEPANACKATRGSMQDHAASPARKPQLHLVQPQNSASRPLERSHAVASVTEVQEGVLWDDPADSYGQLQQAWRDLSCSLQVFHMSCLSFALQIFLCVQLSSRGARSEVLELGEQNGSLTSKQADVRELELQELSIQYWASHASPMLASSSKGGLANPSASRLRSDEGQGREAHRGGVGSGNGSFGVERRRVQKRCRSLDGCRRQASYGWPDGSSVRRSCSCVRSIARSFEGVGAMVPACLSARPPARLPPSIPPSLSACLHARAHTRTHARQITVALLSATWPLCPRVIVRAAPSR